MEKVTFFESIVKILKTITSTPLLIGALVIMIALIVITNIFYFKDTKGGKIVTLCIYIATLVLLLVSHISFFINSLDKIVENLVKILYFQSWYIYTIALLYTDISIFIKIKNSKDNEPKKTDVLDFIYFFVFQLLFFTIIHIVGKERVDIFDSTDLYNNTQLLSLIQVSSYIFWIRVFIKFLVMIINKLSNTRPKPKMSKAEKKQMDFDRFDDFKQEDNDFGNGINNDFYKEPDYSMKLNELNDMYNVQSDENNTVKDSPKIYDIFNSPDIIKTNDTPDNKNNKKEANNNDGFDIDDNSNYFDDFFE